MVTETAPDTSLEDAMTTRPLASISDDAESFLPDYGHVHGAHLVLMEIFNEQKQSIEQSILTIAQKIVGAGVKYDKKSRKFGNPIVVAPSSFCNKELPVFVQDRINHFKSYKSNPPACVRITYPGGAVRTYHLNE